MDETQNDAPFVAFYDMHAVTFVPPDEMADVTIAGLQWFILIPPIKPHGVRKGENTRNQKFLLFPPCFLPISKHTSIFQLHLFCCLQMLSTWLVVCIGV